MKLYFNSKKSEAEWQKTLDKFAFSATPKWFQWLEWVLILGGLGYISDQIDSIALKITLGISGGLFALYFFNYFYQFQLENIPFIKEPKIARIVSIILAGLIGIALWNLFHAVINVLEQTGT